MKLNTTNLLNDEPFLNGEPNVKESIKKFGIRLTKSLGQNFLIDKNIIKRIADSADMSKNDVVVEIGPGLGNMTYHIAIKSKYVEIIEIDKYLIPALRYNLGQFDNVKIINEDVMDIDFNKIFDQYSGATFKVIANLPYYISTPIIMKILENYDRVSSMVLMLQKEVADRINASPGNKTYGSLSVAAQLYCTPKILFNVSASCFFPRPNVDSTVISLNVNSRLVSDLLSKETFFKLLRAAFNQRRKTLLNSLGNSGLFNSKNDVQQILLNIGINPNLRAEALSVSQFVNLSNEVSERMLLRE